MQRIVDAIDDAIGQRVADEVATYRRYHKKPEGTVTVQIEGVAVKSTVPKRPKWDTAVLEEICGELELEGGNPLDWVDYKLTVSEKKYSKAPEAVRRRLDRARTVEHGKEKIELGDDE